jgi:hypothetical protein
MNIKKIVVNIIFNYLFIFLHILQTGRNQTIIGHGHLN